MLLLAIDTSTTAITVAVHDGSRVVAEVTTLDARGHAEHLAPGITRALAGAGAQAGDVTDVVCGLGPGPFTGLRVGIVERDDWASGTSSRSSKMIHGGLRYLASGDVQVVRESLREALTRALAGAKPGEGEVVVVISADAAATHQSVINVMDAARRAQLVQITFATQQSSSGAGKGSRP